MVFFDYICLTKIQDEAEHIVPVSIIVDLFNSKSSFHKESNIHMYKTDV